MIKHYSSKDKIIQNQLKYIIAGTLLGFIGGSGNYFLWYKIPFPPYGNLFATGYVLVITYGLINSLISIDLFTRKLFNSVLIFISIFIPFFIFSFLIKPSLFFTILFSSLAIIITLLLENKLKTFFEPALLGTKYDYLKDIRDLGTKYQTQTFYTTEDLMASFLSNIKNVIGLKNISVFLVKNGEPNFLFFKQIGIEDVSEEKIYISDPLINLLFKNKGYVVKEMIRAEEKEKNNIIQTMNRLKAEVAYPLFVNEELVGILFLGGKETRSMFNGSDFDELNYLVRTCEYKLNMTLSNEQQHLIIDIGRRMSEIHDFSKLAEYVVRTIPRAMNLSYTSIYFFDEKKKNFSCLAENVLDKKEIEKLVLDENNYFLRFLMQRQTPIFARDVFKLSEESGLDDLKLVADTARRLKAEVIIPIICGKPWGFIVLGKKISGEEFSTNDLTNCTILMSNVSSTSQNIVLSDIAVRDQLTELHNRRYLLQMSVEEIAKAIQQRKTLVSFLVDIDHFKKINDTYKHSKGDFVLKKVCMILSNHIRQMDILVRYGGEELLILKYFDSIKEAENYANRLRLAIMNDNELKKFPVTASIGYGVLNVDIEEDMDKLDYDAVLIRQLMFHGADKGLYSAKSQGRNKVCFGGEIKLSDVLGVGFRLKSVIINDDDKVLNRQEAYFKAADCDVKIINSANAEQLVDDWSPDVIFIDGRKIDNWKKLIQQIIYRHATSIVGICLSNITEDLRNEIKELGVTRIFVGEGEATEIASWIRDTKEAILL